jgi:hypothetical protein
MKNGKINCCILALEVCIAVLLATAQEIHAQTASAPAKPKAKKDASKDPATMRLKPYVIKDDQGFKGMEVLHGVMPVDWTLTGGVTWKMALGVPNQLRLHWGDAQDVCAFDEYPTILFCWSNEVGKGGRNQPGQVAFGNIIKQPPADQFDAFDKVIIQMLRPDLANAKVVNKEKLPDAAKTIYAQVNTDPNWPVAVAVGRETVEYELHGQTVQEIIGGVLEIGGGQGPSGYKTWAVVQATSRRAPKGGFDKLKPINAVMTQSLQMNPAWNQKVAELVAQRKQKVLANQAQARANQQAQFNAIESRIASTSAANDAQHASYWQHSADLERQSQNRADVMREVSPWKDSSGTSYKLPTQYGHAWAGADGTILMNNDAGYNPNSDPSLANNTTWTPMEQSHN